MASSSSSSSILASDPTGLTLSLFLHRIGPGLGFITPDGLQAAIRGEFPPKVLGITTIEQYREMVIDDFGGVLMPMLDDNLRDIANLATRNAYSQWMAAGVVDVQDQAFHMLGSIGGWQSLALFELTYYLCVQQGEG
jgi:hypothetical protein